MSPGNRVMTCEWNETSHHGENIMFETVLVRRTSPLRTVKTSSAPTSAISSGVTSSGPKLKKVSKLQEREVAGFFRKMSSAVMSSTVVKPETTEGASLPTSFASRPMMSASSASAVTRSDWSGSTIFPGPMMVVSAA